MAVRGPDGAVVEDAPLAYGGENARRDMELWIAIRESAWRGNVWMDLPLREAREAFERHYLQQKLREVDGNMSRLAQLVGMERTHLYRKLKSHGIATKESRKH